ncbi:hypothetical protein CR983_03355 [Candidatus Saccharibacteria bacterium]|nr:MAG: hypothetical protein CR983_03355 [Candidatus Saccharibacteria bacterium]
MPTPARTTKSAASAKPARTREKMSPSTIIGLLLLACGLVWLAINGGALIERYRMTWYLEEKYGEEFVVTNIKKEGSGLGVRGEINAKASPKNNRSLTFKIANMSNGYHDRYPEALWSSQAHGEVKRYIQANLGEHVDFTARVATRIMPGKTVPESLPNGKIPSLEQALDKYRGIVTYSLSVRDKSSIVTSCDSPTHGQLDRAYKIIQFLKSKGVYSTMNYLYSSDDGSSAPSCIIMLQGEQLETISNSRDLIKYYKATIS